MSRFDYLLMQSPVSVYRCESEEQIKTKILTSAVRNKGLKLCVLLQTHTCLRVCGTYKEQNIISKLKTSKI